MFKRKLNQKYGATRSKCMMLHNHASKLEAAVCNILFKLESDGKIIDITQQPCIKMTEAEISWKVDFSFLNKENGLIEYAEAKGFETSDYLIKKKLWYYYGAGKLYIYKGSHSRVNIAEIINVKGERKS